MESAPWLLPDPAPGVNARDPAFSTRRVRRVAFLSERRASSYFAAFILS
jgi:hypothetical protein